MSPTATEKAYEGEAGDEAGRPADEGKTGRADDIVTVASGKKKTNEPEECSILTPKTTTTILPLASRLALVRP